MLRIYIRAISITFSIALAVGLAFGFTPIARANCPFCTAVSQTLTEELASMDAAVFAKLVGQIDEGKEKDVNAVTKAKFKIVKVLKGENAVNIDEEFETVYFGDGKNGDIFLVLGVKPPTTVWSTPIRVSERAQKYLSSIQELPATGADRLVFFQDFLEDEDSMLARDAYDEFAKAPYADVIGLKEKMNHEKLLGWIENPEISPSRKRLYYTMLGVCGGEKDLPLLEELIRSSDRKKKAGLDALIACYLTLKGEAGLKEIEELFLKNADAEYADTFAAVSALRFHGTEGKVIPVKSIVSSLEYMLDRPNLADLVIPDLARWEDWTVMDKLVALFKNSDEKTSWVRVPVVNYLRACPLPEAKKHLEELKKIDPDSIRRANTFFPDLEEDEDDSDSKDSKDEPSKSTDEKSEKKEDKGTSDQISATGNPATESVSNPLNQLRSQSEIRGERLPDGTQFVSASSETKAARNSRQVAQAKGREDVASVFNSESGTVSAVPSLANWVTVIAFPIALCLIVAVVQWSLFTGKFSRFVS